MFRHIVSSMYSNDNMTDKNASFINYVVRVDDDMYLRPWPIVNQLLEHRKPINYWWGSFAYESWVDRDEENV
jgi:7,8-dihydro-6-hydroxymethylpterin-pyrophosphokinase